MIAASDDRSSTAITEVTAARSAATLLQFLRLIGSAGYVSSAPPTAPPPTGRRRRPRCRSMSILSVTRRKAAAVASSSTAAKTSWSPIKRTCSHVPSAAPGGSNDRCTIRSSSSGPTSNTTCTSSTIPSTTARCTAPTGIAPFFRCCHQTKFLPAPPGTTLPAPSLCPMQGPTTTSARPLQPLHTERNAVAPLVHRQHPHVDGITDRHDIERVLHVPIRQLGNVY